jgi:hypothetical protein
MKPKTYFAIALMLSILVAGIILITGLSGEVLLPVYLLIFFLIYSAIVIIISQKQLEDNIFAACILLVFLSISATFFLISIKTYNDVVNEFGNPDNSPEISLMQTENNYYSIYADYLNQIILQYQSNNKIIENQLVQLKQLRLDQAMQLAIKQTQEPASQQTSFDNGTQQVIIVPETSYMTSSSIDNAGGNDD